MLHVSCRHKCEAKMGICVYGTFELFEELSGGQRESNRKAYHIQQLEASGDRFSCKEQFNFYFI